MGNDLVLTAGGGTHTLVIAPGKPNEFFITGNATLAAPWTVTTSGTPTKGLAFLFHYKATMVLSASTITVFGTELNKDQAGKRCEILCVYDGSAWDVKVLMDSSNLPSEVSGSTSTALGAPGGTISLNPMKDTRYQKLTGSAILAGPWAVTATGTPVAGDEFWVDYQATLTLAASSVTIFGLALSASQALSGKCAVYAKYDGASWSAILFESKVGKADMWEAGSAGTESCRRINSVTGCDATGDYALASGLNGLASGDGAFAHGGTASGDDSVAWKGATASGDGAFAGPGATASGLNSIALGNIALASGIDAVAIGPSTIASGDGSSAIGRTCRATADYARATGYQATAPYQGSKAWSSGRIGIQGDNQELRMKLWKSTTDASATALTGQDGTTGMTIPTDCTANVKIMITAVQTAGASGTIGDSFLQNIELGVGNIAGVSAVIPTAAVTLANYSVVAGNIIYKIPFKMAAFGGSVVVSVAANKIQVTVTGEVNKTISWSADVCMNWVGYRNFTV